MLIILLGGLSACRPSPNRIPPKISVEELKQVVFSDTEHYKIVYLYNPLCGSCISTFSEISDYIENIEENLPVRCYMFSVDSYRWYLPEINSASKEIKTFWISKESEASYQSDTNYVENILRVFIPDSSVSIYEGTPQTLIFSPENILLRVHEGSLVVPADISVLKRNISAINFSIIQQ